MSKETEFFLTDEFATFSKSIAEVHAKLKDLEEEFKVQYEAFKSSKEALNQEAEQLTAKWEEWKQSQSDS